jgi:hypothetical protein
MKVSSVPSSMFWVMILTVELWLAAVCAGAIPNAATAHASHSRPEHFQGRVERFRHSGWF